MFIGASSSRERRRWINPRRMSSLGTSFTDKQGPYLAFLDAYTRVNGRPPAEADMRVASRRNAPELIVRCLTRMFPTLTLAQGRLMAPDRAWVTPRCRTPTPAPSRPARPSGDAGPSAADGRDNSQDARPGAAPAVRAPFATGQRRTRPAAAPSPERAGQAGTGPASASAWVARWASPPPPSRPFAARPETSRSTVHRPRRTSRHPDRRWRQAPAAPLASRSATEPDPGWRAGLPHGRAPPPACAGPPKAARTAWPEDGSACGPVPPRAPSRPA